MNKLLIIAVVLFFISCEQNKIGFVNAEIISEKYEGAKNLNTQIQGVMDIYSKERDSIYKVFQAEVIEFQKKYNGASNTAKKTTYDGLADKSKKIEQYLQSKEQMLSQQNNKKLDSLADEIRGFIKNYGQKNSYTFILGQNQTANILYGDPSKDITQDVLKLLNEQYEKKSDSTSSKN